MRFAVIAILLQLTICVVVQGRFWGKEVKRENAALASKDKRGACSPYYNIDVLCAFSKFPKVYEMLRFRGDFQEQLHSIREEFKPLCRDFTGWLTCIKDVYDGLSEECREEFSPKLAEREAAVQGLLDVFDTICVKEIKNTRKHINCYTNYTLIMEAGDCTRDRENWGFQCDLDKLYDCVGEKIEDTHECRAGARGYLEKFTRPIISTFKVCPIPGIDEPSEDYTQVTQYRSVEELFKSLKETVSFLAK